jgi:hypothetical protein
MEGGFMADVRTVAPPVPAIANPAALGLAAFALTTFLLSIHNAMGVTREPLLVFWGFALFYGGLAQVAAGMWEFKTGNTFGATAFSTYGAFWMSLATFVVLVLAGKVPAGDILKDEGWFFLAFAIFNTYMMLWSLRVNVAVFAVFLTLEITEILLMIGAFGGSGAGQGMTQIGAIVGVVTAFVAWYASAATVANSMRVRPILPVGAAIWAD